MISEWLESNGQAYLHVEADHHYDLGVATGKGMVKQIAAPQSMSKLLPILLKTTPAEFLKKAQAYLPYIPQKYQDELQGMADGASEAAGKEITFEKILMSSLSLEVLYGQYNFDPASIDMKALKAVQGCTCFGAVNSDGSTIMGQNYDAPASSQATMAWVLSKVADEPYVFSARLGASPGMPVGKNAYGLAMIVNVIISNVTAPVMKPRFVRAREAFATCKTAPEAYKVMYEGDQFPFSLNMLISDPERVIGVQILPHEIRSNFAKTTLVQANKYDYVDWQKYLRDPNYSLERHQRATSLLEQAYTDDNPITNDKLLDIMRDSPIICRDEGNGRAATVAFMTRESFGLGNARGNVGVIPI